MLFLFNRQVHAFDPLFRLFVRVRKPPPHHKLVFHYAWKEISSVSAFCDHVKHAAGDSLRVMSSSSVCKVGYALENRSGKTKSHRMGLPAHTKLLFWGGSVSS